MIRIDPPNNFEIPQLRLWDMQPEMHVIGAPTFNTPSQVVEVSRTILTDVTRLDTLSIDTDRNITQRDIEDRTRSQTPLSTITENTELDAEE